MTMKWVVIMMVVQEKEEKEEEEEEEKKEEEEEFCISPGPHSSTELCYVQSRSMCMHN